jgi:hypothetical protein
MRSIEKNAADSNHVTSSHTMSNNIDRGSNVLEQRKK